LDLISKVAHLQQEQPTDFVQWYVDRYGREPDYAALLEELCPTATERNLLLRGYFEPTDDVCPTDADYEATFDRFEYLYCLIAIDL